MENITIGDMQHIIVNIASIIASGGVVCAFALKIGKGVLDKSLKPFSDKMEEMEKARIDQHEETKRELYMVKKELDKNSLNTMKNTICNENIPISERLIVGKEYIDKGGNGAVKIYLHNLADEYEKQLKGDAKNGKKKGK